MVDNKIPPRLANKSDLKNRCNLKVFVQGELYGTGFGILEVHDNSFFAGVAHGP